MNFKDQYRHPKWQEKRLLVLQANGFTCQECGEKEKELHVHHPFYRNDSMVWDYATGELMCLCCDCHKGAHAIDESIKIQLSARTYSEKKMVLRYVKSFRNATELKKFYLTIKNKLAIGEI